MNAAMESTNGAALQIVHRRGIGAAAAELREGTTGRGTARTSCRTTRPHLVARPAAGIAPKLWAVGEPVTATAPPALLRKPEATQPTRPRPDLAFYRKYTEAMLRRWTRLAMSPGRVPSILGREMFRGKVTSYRMHSFDDAVNFTIDMERAVGRLQPEEAELLRRIAIQEFTQGETAALLGMSLRDVVRKYGAALDRLTGILLALNMLEPLHREAAGDAAEA